MTTSLLIVAVLVSSTIGYLIVSLITYRISNSLLFTSMKIALGIGIGYGVTSLLSFLWQVIVGDFYNLYIVFEFLFGGLLYWQYRKLIMQKASTFTFDFVTIGEKNLWTYVLQFFLVGVLSIGLLVFVLATIVAPNGMWDAWMVQNRAARFFYLGGDYWTNAFSALLVSADYPLLVGESVARLWRYAGHETVFGPAFFSLTITFALIIFFISVIFYFRGRTFAYLAGLTLLSSSALIVFAPAQLADIPVAFYFLATIALLRIYLSAPQAYQSILYLTGITSGLAAWTKNEGWLFLFAICMAFFILIALKKIPFPKTLLLRFTCGLLPVLLIVLIFKFGFAPASDLVRDQSSSFSFSGYFSRYLIIGVNYFIQLYDLTADRSSPLIFLFFISLIFGVDIKALRNNTGVVLSFFVLVITIVGEFFVYSFSPYDLNWQVPGSIHRLFLQIWPVFVFETMMLIDFSKFDESKIVPR